MDFGEKLQNLRKENGLSQEQLAEKLNVSRQAVSKWESGALPDVDNIVKISSFFDCSLDYLLGKDSPKVENIDEQGKGIVLDKKKSVSLLFCELQPFFIGCCCSMVVLRVLVKCLANIIDTGIMIIDSNTGQLVSRFCTFIEVYKLSGFINVCNLILVIGIFGIFTGVSVKRKNK